MRLKEAINALMDYAKEKNSDINVAAAKLDYEITSGKRQDFTSAELDMARAFIIDNYNVVVNARESGDWSVADELIALW